jgi:hypothetical protein
MTLRAFWRKLTRRRGSDDEPEKDAPDLTQLPGDVAGKVNADLKYMSHSTDQEKPTY